MQDSYFLHLYPFNTSLMLAKFMVILLLYSILQNNYLTFNFFFLTVVLWQMYIVDFFIISAK